MAERTAILNVVGLTPRLIGEDTPKIRAFMEKSRSALIEPVVPAVTCTAQSSIVTGTSPATCAYNATCSAAILVST